MPLNRRRKSRPRKQRVALRARRRDDMSKQVQQAMLRLGALGACGAAIFFFAMHSDSFLHRFAREHTPVVTLQPASELAGLPFHTELPGSRIWLWVPGVTGRITRQWQQRYPAVEKVRVEKSWETQRITFLIRARTPLIEWNRRGVDSTSTVFPLAASVPANLPRLVSSGSTLSSGMGVWLKALSRYTGFWSQISFIKEDLRGHWQIHLKNGLVILWGDAQSDQTTRRLDALTRVQEDAEIHGGMRQIDLRFFDEGRIIVAGRNKR